MFVPTVLKCMKTKYATGNLTANQLTMLIKDILVIANLPLHHYHGQCYDGAANMSGLRTGASIQIRKN